MVMRDLVLIDSKFKKMKTLEKKVDSTKYNGKIIDFNYLFKLGNCVGKHYRIEFNEDLEAYNTPYHIHKLKTPKKYSKKKKEMIKKFNKTFGDKYILINQKKVYNPKKQKSSKLIKNLYISRLIK